MKKFLLILTLIFGYTVYGQVEPQQKERIYFIQKKEAIELAGLKEENPIFKEDTRAVIIYVKEEFFDSNCIIYFPEKGQFIMRVTPLKL